MIGSYIQEQPLDLTVKKTEFNSVLEVNKVDNTKHLVPPFDLGHFFNTYQAIATRQYPDYPVPLSHDCQDTEQQELSRKRKLISSSSQPSNKVIKIEAGQCEPDTKVKKETVKSSGVWQPYHETAVPERKAKKSRKLVNSAISSITRLCDCKGCYQQHILRMRADKVFGSQPIFNM